MRLVTFLLIGIPVMGFLKPLQADSAGAAQAAIGFTGGSTITGSSSTGITGICEWYLPLVGDLGVTTTSTGAAALSPALFSDPANPSTDTAHLVWVSPFSAAFLPVPGSPQTVLLAPAGAATIYYSDKPSHAFWTDPAHNGVVVATFIRHAGLLQSGDGLATDSFIFTAELTSSRTFVLNGRAFNFRDLIPNGMTCFETGRIGSSSEVGTCVAIGDGH